jgi:hypothetical protein
MKNELGGPREDQDLRRFHFPFKGFILNADRFELAMWPMSIIENSLFCRNVQYRSDFCFSVERPTNPWILFFNSSFTS